MNVSQALQAVTDGATLSQAEAQAVLSDIVEGDVSALQVAALLGALRARGETADELVGFARAMRARAVPVEATSSPLIDTCGTGGDAARGGLGTFNISTAAAIVASAAGAHIAKHGNRAVSSRSGSADVLEALGVHLDLQPPAIARCIDQIGLGFMFAPNHHPAMKNVAPIRRELGIRTIFNLIGPLTNPAGAKRQVMGVPARKWLRPIAETLRDLGCERALVVHSRDGLDEFSTCTPTDVVELNGGELREWTFDPESGGVSCLNIALLSGGDAAHKRDHYRAGLARWRGAERGCGVSQRRRDLDVRRYCSRFGRGHQTVARHDCRERGARKVGAVARIYPATSNQPVETPTCRV